MRSSLTSFKLLLPLIFRPTGLVVGVCAAFFALSACSKHDAPIASTPSVSASSAQTGYGANASSTAVVGPSTIVATLEKKGVDPDNLGTLTLDQYNDVVVNGNGFPVGPEMAKDVAYIFFDPQCPHCTVSWTQSLPLQHETRIVWMPVAFINSDSLPQGAALLSAADPTALMTAHEANMVKGQNGMVTMGTDKTVSDKIMGNMKMIQVLKATSVPFMIHKSADGVVHTVKGEMTTDQMKALLDD